MSLASGLNLKIIIKLFSGNKKKKKKKKNAFPLNFCFTYPDSQIQL